MQKIQRILRPAWWIFAIRGAIWLIFGIGILLWADITIQTMITLFGLAAMAVGVISIIGAFQQWQGDAAGANRDERLWWALVAGGIIGIVIGLISFIWPNISGSLLYYLIAFYAIATGALDGYLAFQLKDKLERNDWYMLLASSVAGLIFGLWAILTPGDSIQNKVLIAGYMIVLGGLLLFITYRLRILRLQSA